MNYYPRHTLWSKMWTETPAEVWEQDMAAAAKLGVNTVRTLKGDTEDCWVKDIVMRETLNNVQVWRGCRRFTITGAHSYHNSTVEKGAGYAADISIRGSQVLVDRCSSHRLGGF